MKLKTVSMTLMLIVLLSAMLGTLKTSTLAEEEEYIHSLEVSVSPEFPNTNDEVNVTISFVVESAGNHEVSQSPYDCGDFFVFFYAPTIPFPPPPPEATNYTFICPLGKLPAGQHNFEVYIAICFCDSSGITCTLPLSYLTETIPFTVRKRGDVDGDGVVGKLDLGLFADAYGSKCGDPNYDPRCDFDHDCDVDYYDLGIFADNYGKP